MKNISLTMMDWLKFKSLFQEQRFNLLVLCITCLVFSCVPKRSNIFKNQNIGAALGTSYSLIYLAEEELDFQKEIDSVFTVINQSMSTYIANSDISKINAGDSAIVVDKMFEEVFELSKEIHKNTNGYFDPTVGSLVNAWGFGPGKQIELDSTKVDSLMQFVGFDKVSITTDRTIQKQNSNIRFDFNAIAKGYAIDRLAILMDKKGIENYLLEVGGEVVAKGENTVKQKPWNVAVTDPESDQYKIVIALKDRAMASSGNYRHFRVDPETGDKYVHTIDPITGFTKNGKTLGVNILAENCAIADAYATAFMAMDIHETINFLENQNELDAYLLFLDDKGKTQEFMSQGFRKLIVN